MNHPLTIFSSLTTKFKNLVKGSENSDYTISQQEYNKLVADLCRQIKRSNWRPSYVVGITRGGLLPAVMISHYFNVEMCALHPDESNLWMAEDAFGYTPREELDQQLYMEVSGIPVSSARARKDILIVDDINDTGATLNRLVEDWQSGCLPDNPTWNTVWNQNVKFATVVNNKSNNFKKNIDFFAKEIDKSKNDSWIVFPYEQWWMND